MRYCPLCATPILASRLLRWKPNGTISLRGSPDSRLALLDASAITSFLECFDARSEAVESLIFEESRASGHEFTNSWLHSSSASRLTLLAARALKDLKTTTLRNLVATLGYCSVGKISSSNSTPCDFEILEPFQPASAAGLICGIWESLSGKEYYFKEISQAPGGETLRLVPSGKRRKVTTPPAPERAPEVPGRNVMEICSFCRVPLEFSERFYFDCERGVIEEIRNSERVVFIELRAFRNVVSAMERMFDGEVSEKIAELEKARARRIIERTGSDLEHGANVYLKYTRALRIRGMGNPSEASISGKTVRITIDNPCFEAIVAAYLGGLYEAATGLRCTLQWSEARQGICYVTVSPA